MKKIKRKRDTNFNSNWTSVPSLSKTQKIVVYAMMIDMYARKEYRVKKHKQYKDLASWPTMPARLAGKKDVTPPKIKKCIMLK